jgi:hypothetical protein
MLAQRPKLFIVRYISSGILLGLLFGCLLAFVVGKTPIVENKNAENRPVRTVTITITPSWKNELFVKLRKFAEMWRYAVLIAPSDQSDENYVVQFWRLDMKMMGLYSISSGKLELGFFNTNPAGRNPWWFFDDELKDLESLISEIPNSTFSVEK